MVPLLSGALMATMFNWPGTPQDRQSESDVLEVGPDFFSTMQIPFVAGRGFDSSDYGIAAQARQSDRKSTRLNSSHPSISYAVFCLKTKTRGRWPHRLTGSCRTAGTPSGR